MILQNDTIKLEDKIDIDKMISILDAYLASHPDEEIEQLKRDLDRLWYNW
jgi:hypothetical protein